MFPRRFSSLICLVAMLSLSSHGCLMLGRQVAYDPPVWSPQSDRIAFAAQHGENWDIYQVNVDGTVLTQLTDSPELDRDPDWSPDGKSIVFVSYRDRGYKDNQKPEDCCGDIYVIQVDSLKITRLTQDGYFPSSPRWSPDGKQIVFISQDEIYLMNADGSKKTKLVSHRDRNGKIVLNSSPVWSPDGKKIAFSSPGLSVINTDGSDRIDLAGDFDDYSLSWSPDSQKIVYYRTKMAGNAKNIQAVSQGIWIADVQGSSKPKKLADGSDPTWLRNTQKIAFTCKANKPENKAKTSEICLLDPDGSNLTKLEANGSGFTWSPNGRKIAFNYSQNDTDRIYVMNSDGSGVTQLTGSRK